MFLGASFAGLGASHYFLKHVEPHLPHEPSITYKAILIDPSSKWYTRPAAPRGAIAPDLIPIDKMFYDTQAGFKQYGDKVQFLQGKATSWDEKARTLTIEKANGQAEVISYWALVLATGSKTDSPIFALQGTPHTDVEDALRSLHDQLSTAKEIVVVGGGAAGVETAGELGDLLNGPAGWFQSRLSHPKARITLITSSSKLLPQLRQSIAEQAERYLARVGVDVRYNVKVASTESLEDGRTRAMLHDGEELDADVYIPATGVRPMSEYASEHLKDKKGYVINNASTLRVDAAGPRVYAVGDIGTYSRDNILDIIDSLPVAVTNLKRDLLAAHSDPDAKPEGPDRQYVRNEKETQAVPVGRSKGVGAVFGWRFPSFLIWLIKGRDYMIGSAYQRVDGEAWVKDVISKY